MCEDMWRQNAGSQKGNLFVKKEVSFNFEDASGNPLSGVELYLQDNPSDYAKNATFAEPTMLLINTLRHHMPIAEW